MRVRLGCIALIVSLTAGAAAAPAATGGKTLYVDPGGSDSSRCTKTAPCRTFQRAYAVASLGDTVQVAAGDYPEQDVVALPGDPPPAARVVTFRAQGTVTLAGLSLGDQFTNPNGPSNLAFVGIRGTNQWSVLPDSRNITFDHVRTTNIQASNVDGYTVVNSDFGNCTVTDVNGPCDNFKVDNSSSNILIANNTFHDFRISPGSSEHFECMFLGGSSNTTVRGNVFRNCEYFDVFVQPLSTFSNGLRIQGNWFDAPWDGHGHRSTAALWFSGRGGAWSNVTVSRNSFHDSSMHIDDSASVSDYLVERNLLGATDCFPGVTYDKNFWSNGRTCGPDDLRRTPFGYSLDDGKLALRSADAAALRLLFRTCASGSDAVGAAKVLRREKASRSRRHWTAAVVRSIVADDTYLGGAFGSRGSTPAVTWPAQFKKAQRLCGAPG